MNKPTLVRITTIPISFVGLLKGQLKFMSNYFSTHAISSSGESFKHVEENENTSIHVVEMKREPSPLKDWSSLWAMRRMIRKINPDIVHTHTPKAGLLGMVAAYLNKVPVRLHTVAGIPWMESQGLKRRILMFVEKLTYRFSTHVYSNSHVLRDFILENRLIDENKISVIANGSSNGINTEHFNRTDDILRRASELKSEFNIADQRVVLFVGRLVKDKGIEELLSAFENLQSKYNLKLLLVGSYEFDRDPLSEKAMKMISSDPNIITTGFVNDVRPYMAISHLLAFPSYREGFPNVPMQAGAMGLPCIVTDINGCNEIIIEGENGVIIPAKDAEALQNALESLLVNEGLFNKLAGHARDHITRRYDQKVIWDGLLKEYKEHLNKANVQSV